MQHQESFYNQPPRWHFTHYYYISAFFILRVHTHSTHCLKCTQISRVRYISLYCTKSLSGHKQKCTCSTDRLKILESGFKRASLNIAEHLFREFPHFIFSLKRPTPVQLTGYMPLIRKFRYANYAKYFKEIKAAQQESNLYISPPVQSSQWAATAS